MVTAQGLHIGLYPAATANSASSRLRCFGLGRELAHLGYRVRVGVDMADLPQVLLVQKIINAEALHLATLVKSAGGTIVYDIDDYGAEALGSLKADEETFRRFMALVSVVVVDTEVRRSVFAKEPGFTHVQELWVVPDPIDYIDSVGLDNFKPPKAAGEKLRACWFGNAPNIVPAVPFLDALVHSERVADVKVITNASHLEQFYGQYPQFVNSAWTLETFPALLRAMDFCVLIHSTSLEGVQKSNNKMLAALAMGVVPFVSRTPAYEETADQIGVPELVVDSPADLLVRIEGENFAPIVRKIQAEQCARELEKYLPSVSARLFSDKLLAFLNGVPEGA